MEGGLRGLWEVVRCIICYDVVILALSGSVVACVDEILFQVVRSGRTSQDDEQCSLQEYVNTNKHHMLWHVT